MNTGITRVAVLGGGLVGGSIARRLAGAAGLEVTLFDRDASTLARAQGIPGLALEQGDLAGNATLARVAERADAVVLAVPGAIGFVALRALLEHGRNVVDISFTPEDPRGLDALARARGATAIVDCGVMPGLGGMLALELARRVAPARSVSIMVGGLPVVRTRPFEYKAPFSPSDVIEEYVRPARLRRDGTVITRPALSEVELVDLPGVGTVEAFLTDGLRTLLDHCDAPNLCEKTLRWPGHAALMQTLRDAGFFSPEPVAVEGTRVRAVAVTEQLLRRAWRLEPDDDEVTVMRVEATGMRDGNEATVRVDVLDRRDRATGDSSMARTTGLPAILALRLLLAGRIAGPGVIPAELLGRDPSALAFVLDGLADEGVSIRFS